MKLTNEQKQQIYFLIDKYGKDYFNYNYNEHKIYLDVIMNSSIFRQIFLLTSNSLISQFKIRDDFYKKYIRSKKLSNFISPS